MWSWPRESTARLLWMPTSPIESTVWIWKLTAWAGAEIPKPRRRTAQKEAAARGDMVAPVVRLGGRPGTSVLRRRRGEKNAPGLEETRRADTDVLLLRCRRRSRGPGNRSRP